MTNVDARPAYLLAVTPYENVWIATQAVAAVPLFSGARRRPWQSLKTDSV